MSGLSRNDAEWIGSQMEIGTVKEVTIGDTTQTIDLGTEMELTYPAQVTLLAEEAGCFVYQGDADVLEVGWSWPTAKHRLLANERMVLNIRSVDSSCLAVIQNGASEGTLVITETRIR